ncbi:MAG TPA: hypothetical protein VLL76_03020 [Candidatus Omnitrophota bacterium]|nr:hypothetical protein [Candidatus Omnitrophota bacterium]
MTTKITQAAEPKTAAPAAPSAKADDAEIQRQRRAKIALGL